MFDELPTGPQWTITSDDVGTIVADYGLVYEPSNQPEQLGGAINGVTRISHERGDAIIRVHRPWTTPSRLTAVHDVMGTLREAGLPVPFVFTAASGKTWSTIADRLVEVQEFIPSDRPARKRTDAMLIFAELGMLHRVLSTLMLPQIPASPYDSYAPPARALAMLDETEHIFVGDHHSDQALQARALRARARAVLACGQRVLSKHAHALPRQLTHGDFGGDNVLLRDEQVVGILDFDFMDTRERIYDLAYTMVMTLLRSRTPPQLSTLDDGEIADIARWRDAYETLLESSLSSAEISALPTILAQILLYQLSEIGYQIKDGDTEGALLLTQGQEMNLALAEWIITHQDAFGTP